MKWQEFVKEYLTFTRKERIGILVISILLVLIFSLPEIILRTANKPEFILDTSFIKAVKKLEIKNETSFNSDNHNEGDEETNAYQFDKTKNNYFEKAQGKGELFYFDPNTIAENEWKKLGVRDKTIKTIQNYINKGGSFRTPEELKKIYGLHPDEFKRLAPFIKIENTKADTEEEIVSVKTQSQNQQFKNAFSRYNIVEVNEADTTAFISLPGIGSKLAARIINFRDKLGGFYSIEQVGETYGLPDSTYQKIKQYLKLDNPSVKKININTATIDELKAHPYIKYGLANPINAYRNEHGNFSKVEDIKKVMAVSEDIYKKIRPYLSTQ